MVGDFGNLFPAIFHLVIFFVVEWHVIPVGANQFAVRIETVSAVV